MVGTNESITKIAAIGDKNVVLAFKAVGADIFPYTNANKIKEVIRELADKDYAIILVTEVQAKEIDEFIATFASKTYPIILPIPNGAERVGYGAKRVQQFILKATSAINKNS